MATTVTFDNLDSWLKSQPDNTPNTPYCLNITFLTVDNIKESSYSSSLGYVIKSNNTKYVDLSYTTLPPDARNGNEIFKDCTNLVRAPELPPLVTNIRYIFYNCTALKEAPAIPENVTIMQSSFYNCSTLKTAPVIPNGVIFMGGCFYGCIALKEAPQIPNTVTSLNLCFGNCGFIVAPVIPSSVTDLNWCFFHCSSLREMPEIPNSVTSMDYCFAECTSLTETTVLRGSVTNMNRCFYNCNSIKYKPIIPSSVTSSTDCYYNVTTTKWKGTSSQVANFISAQTGEFIVLNDDTNKEICGVDIENLSTFLSEQEDRQPNNPYNIKILNLTTSNVMNIRSVLIDKPTKIVDLSYTTLPNITSANNLFNGCESLVKSPDLPSTVTNMNYCFYGCTNLTESPAIPSNVTTMAYCFSDCMSLTAMPIIPSGVTSIQYAFRRCENLVTTTNIPNSVTYMWGCFERCTSLRTPPALPSVDSLLTVFSGSGITSAPTIPSSVTAMVGTFSGCSNLRTAPTIPNSVVQLEGTFSGCISLSAPPVLPSSLTSMDEAFKNCRFTTAPAIPNTVTTMNNAFENVPITTVTKIPSSVTKMKECFKGCTALTKIELFEVPLNTLKNNANFQNAFQNCSSLRQIGSYETGIASSWHVYSLKINSGSFSGKIYDTNGNSVNIPSTNITRSTLSLPNLTDEILFPPSGLSDADLNTLIQNVISSKYTWYKKQVLNPNSKNFVLWADDPENALTNITPEIEIPLSVEKGGTGQTSLSSVTVGNATNVNVATSNSNTAYPLVFAPNVTAGNKRLYTDTANEINYNPSTNQLQVTGNVNASNLPYMSAVYSSNTYNSGYFLLAQLEGTATNNHDVSMSGVVYYCPSGAGSARKANFWVIARGNGQSVTVTKFLVDNVTVPLSATYEAVATNKFIIRLYGKISANYQRFNTVIEFASTGDVFARVSNRTVTFPNTQSSALTGTSIAVDRYMITNANSARSLSEAVTCSTAGGTSAKTVDLSGFVLVKGAKLIVNLQTANTVASALTLNVNGTGAKTIRWNGSVTSSSAYAMTAGYYNCYYDGTYWNMDSTYEARNARGAGWADGATQADYSRGTAYCSTASGTQAKVVSMRGYVLAVGAFPITFTNANSYDGKITLNINSRGAKDLWINGEVTSTTNKTLPAGTYMCFYDGTEYLIDTRYGIPMAHIANAIRTSAPANPQNGDIWIE